MNYKMKEAEAETGEMGQKKLIQGDHARMRLWQNEQVVDKTFVAQNYETLGYVIAGDAVLHIDGKDIILEAGDSWKVPKGVEHSYTIKNSLKAVEVCCEG